MNPQAAYAHAAKRSRRLLSLYDGLVNLRKYRIRKDWKASFCDIMHWPKTSEIDRVDTRQAVIILREGSSLNRDDFSSLALEDLLRASLLTAVSGLDRYVHERVVGSIVAALKRPDLSPRQTEFSIPAVLALQAAEAVRRAGREKKKQARPANEVRKRIQGILHKESFQSWRQIEEAFELVGVAGFCGQMQALYRVPDIDPIRSQLNDIIDKRNRIAHEADLVRHARGGKPRPSPMGTAFVEDSLDFLDDFVARLERVRS